eukprot:1981002-Alexandrium_andersonii.AAC.1
MSSAARSALRRSAHQWLRAARDRGRERKEGNFARCWRGVDADYNEDKDKRHERGMEAWRNHNRADMQWKPPPEPRNTRRPDSAARVQRKRDRRRDQRRADRADRAAAKR